MNRMEEFNALDRELDNTPAELEYTVTRARARAKGRRRARRWGLPLGSLAGVFAAFVLLVNAVPTFALACSGIPVLGDLAAAVDWSGSLSRAVENDYVQIIGQSRTKNGITMTAEYVIVDQQQVNLFVSVKNEDKTKPCTVLSCDISVDGREFTAVAEGQQEENGGLRRYIIDFSDKNQVPDHMTVTFGAYPYESLSAADEAGRPADSGRAEAEFTFTISFDPSYTASGKVCGIGRWLELDGQRIYVEALEIYPTHARLKLGDSEDNTMRLQDLNFYLEDDDGNRYEMESGIGGYSDPVTGFAFDRRVASPWFSKAKHLTVCITGVSWLDPEKRDVTVDLVDGTASGLPDGTKLTGVYREEDGIRLAFEAPLRGLPACNLFDWTYFDPTGQEYDCTGGGVSTRDDEDIMTSYVFLKQDYAYDTVTLRLSRTLWYSLETPTEITVY
jgi:hypothetical protein